MAHIMLMVLLAVVCIVSGDTLSNGDIRKNVNILNYEVNKLKETIAKKESSLQELRNCLLLSREMYNVSTDSSATRPFIRLITQIKQYAVREKYLYGSIRRKIDGFYPPELLINGPQQSSTMMNSMVDIFRSASNFVRPEDEDHEPIFKCKAKTFQDMKYWTLVQTDNASATEECNIKDSLPLPDGRFVTWTYDRIRYCHKNGTALRRIRLPREPYIIAYFKDNIILVESFLEKAKLVQMVNLTSGLRLRPLVARFSGRFVSSGLSVYDSNIFVLDKSEFLNIIPSSLKGSTEIYGHHGRLHFKSIFPLPAEAGSSYGAILGEITHHKKILIKGTGQAVCSIDNPLLARNDERGFVSSKGHIFYPNKAYNKVYVFDKDCIPTGDRIELPSDQYLESIRGINDTLFVVSNTRTYKYNFM